MLFSNNFKFFFKNCNTIKNTLTIASVFFFVFNALGIVTLCAMKMIINSFKILLLDFNMRTFLFFISK